MMGTLRVTWMRGTRGMRKWHLRSSVSGGYENPSVGAFPREWSNFHPHPVEVAHLMRLRGILF